MKILSKIEKYNVKRRALNIMWYKKILLFLILLVTSCFSIAQQIKNEKPANTYRLVHWGRDDGLSAEERNTMLKDINGFLWIGSPHGLNRFDGSNFTHYFPDKNKPGTIIGANINNLIEDSLHNIWIGTEKGMSRYDIKGDTFSNFLPSKNAAYKFVEPFWATKDEVYCIEAALTVTTYNIHTFQKKEIVTISSEYAFGDITHSVYDAKTNSIWMAENADGKHSGGLFQISLTDGKKNHYKWKCYQKISNHDHTPMDICYDAKRNAIWISNRDGLNEFTIDDKQFHHADALNGIVNAKKFKDPAGVGVDLQGNVWWSSWPAGPIIYNPDTQSFIPVFSTTPQQQQVAYANLYIYCDRNGMVWTSCLQQLKGVYQIIPASIPVVHYAPGKTPHSLSGSFLNNMINADHGKLWIGQGDELNIYDPQTGFFQIVSSKKDLPAFHGRLIMPIQIDSIHQKALFDIWDQKSRVSEVYEMDIPTRKCRHVIFKDSSGKIISSPPTGYNMISYKNGAILFSDGDAGIFFVNTNSAIGRWISPSIHSLEGVFGTDNDHLIFIRRTDAENLTYSWLNNKWTRIKSPIDSLEWSAFYYNKKDETFWVGSSGELYHYNKDFGLIHQYTMNDGLIAEAITGILSDNHGNIWLQFDRDILKLNIQTGKFTSLSEKDGLVNPSNVFSNPVATDGDLYFFIGPGIDRINPEKLAETYPASIVYFKSVQINQKPFSFRTSINSVDKLSLHYFENNIIIETGVIDYYSKGKNNIRFKLEGGDIKNANWEYEPVSYTIRYEQLPPESYKLVIQTSNAANEFNGPEKVLLITISPAFWNEWWFRLIIILIASYIIVRIVKERIQKINHDVFFQNQLKELEMKAFKAQMNPHFIYNALNSIQALIASDKKDEGIHYIGSFSRLLRQVLENSENNIISLDKELETIGLYIQMETLRLDMQLQYKKNIPKDVITEFEKTPPLILQPFVENALWHGLSRKQGKKEIEISVSVKDGWLLCEITDNGVGRIKAQELKSNSTTLHRSKGIDITRKRLIDFNEDASVVPIEFFDLYDEKQNPSGTRVTVHIKRKSGLLSV
ncbi:MAG: histidine kinase [Parafilimonas sp.]